MNEPRSLPSTLVGAPAPPSGQAGWPDTLQPSSPPSGPPLIAAPLPPPPSVDPTGGSDASSDPPPSSPRGDSARVTSKSPPWAWITAAALAVTTILFATLYFTRESAPANNAADPAVNMPRKNTGGTSTVGSTAGHSAIPTGDRIRTGTYQVPSEFPPGLYRVGTLWRTVDAAGDEIGREWNLDGPGLMVIPEVASKIVAVEVQGGAWLLDESKPLNPFAYSDGTYLVGVDIQPGKYRVTGVQQSTNVAYAARLDERLEIIENEVKSDTSVKSGTDSSTAVDPSDVYTVTMEIMPTDFAFKFTGQLEKLD